MSRSAFEIGWIKHRPILRNFALRLTRDNVEAEELLQEVGHKAFKYWNQFKEGSNMKSWLFTIMKNSHVNNWRKKKTFITLEEYSASSNSLLTSHRAKSGITWNLGESQIMMKELTDIVDGINEQLRDPFLMYYEGYSYEEIAQKLGLPMGTVKSRIFMARKLLRTKIQAAF